MAWRSAGFRLIFGKSSCFSVRIAKPNEYLRQVQSNRNLSESPTKSELKTPDSKPAEEPIFKPKPYKCTAYDKKVLVWTGKFKKVEDVPDEVSIGVITKARDKMRIYRNMFLGFLTILCSIVYIMEGKRMARQGITRTSQWQEKQDAYNKRMDELEAAQKAKSQ